MKLLPIVNLKASGFKLKVSLISNNHYNLIDFKCYCKYIKFFLK
jgi:hypothetical protein